MAQGGVGRYLQNDNGGNANRTVYWAADSRQGAIVSDAESSGARNCTNPKASALDISHRRDVPMLPAAPCTGIVIADAHCLRIPMSMIREANSIRVQT